MGEIVHTTHVKDTRDEFDVETSARLSRRLRQARHIRGMTLKVLSEAAGCSESLLSKIENAKACPSLPMLHRLAQTLEVSIGWLFEDGGERLPVVSRAGDRQRAALTEAIRIERVVPNDANHLLRCDILHIEPGAGSPAAQQHEGEETGYLLEGELELTVDGRVHRLAAGDAFAFRAERPHSFRNLGPAPTSVFWVATPSIA